MKSTCFTGGVLADRGDRRRLIVLSRSAAVLGFVVLAVNASAPEPSLTVLYVVAAWDGLAGGFLIWWESVVGMLHIVCTS